ncbi:Hypothetical protein A7982_02980 [Minicystis rosea]|nr:Hypothetical protein A7982_02980 [Minicystis rosea]
MGDVTRIAQIEAVIRDWLEEPDITLFCGDWRSGSIMEILPEGRAVLTGARYPEPFSGLRDITLADQGHHLHLDLAKLGTVVYAVAPSVCYGYRPSFEIRFSDAASGAVAFSMGLREPYHGRRTNRAALVPYFRRLLAHHVRHRDVIRFRIETSAYHASTEPESWREVYDCWVEAGGAGGAGGARGPAVLGPEALSLAMRSALGDGAHA